MIHLLMFHSKASHRAASKVHSNNREGGGGRWGSEQRSKPAEKATGGVHRGAVSVQLIV